MKASLKLVGMVGLMEDLTVIDIAVLVLMKENRSIRIRDNSGTGSAMTSQAFNLTSYDSVEVKFYFYSYSMENGEDFWLRFYNGSSWSTVGVWARGTSFENNNYYSCNSYVK